MPYPLRQLCGQCHPLPSGVPVSAVGVTFPLQLSFSREYSFILKDGKKCLKIVAKEIAKGSGLK